MRELVRIANTDIKGQKSISIGLCQIKGISHSFSHALCTILNFDRTTKVGALTDDQIKHIEDTIKNPVGIPVFLKNRRNDYDTGTDRHLTGVDVKLQAEFDVRRMKKIKSYKGLRHAWGLPVRGQRTRGNFRTGQTVGVMKKAVKLQLAAAASKDGGKKKD